jgi:hypothetical protein
MNISLKLAGIGFLFLLIIISGIWLAKTGKPYQPALFNVHKLISLAAIALTGVVLYNILKTTQGSSVVFILLMIAVLFLLALIVTGGMLNLEKPYYNILLIIHRIISPLSILVLIGIFWILLKK